MLEILKCRFPSFQFSQVPWTSHWNVVRMFDVYTGKFYIAKAIVDYIDPNITNENRKAMNQSWEFESTVLTSLPSWWGLEFADSFREGPIRIIVTSEIPNLLWVFYKPSRQLDRQIALDLEKQLRWMLDAGISHNDLELKNILFTGSSAVIIDFEKATYGKGRDIDKIIDSFYENENTRGIANVLKERLRARRNISRRASMRRNK